MTDKELNRIERDFTNDLLSIDDVLVVFTECRRARAAEGAKDAAIRKALDHRMGRCDCDLSSSRHADINREDCLLSGYVPLFAATEGGGA